MPNGKFLFQVAVIALLTNIALEHYRAELAVARGLDKDPLAVWLIEHKREGILVEHLYQDSIRSKVRTTEAQERKYYQGNVTKFFTYPTVSFAGFNRPSEESADSLVQGGATCST